jgi:hypothetical protein
VSTGADCRFVETKPGEWRYAIQRWPYGDWPEYDKKGPFPSFAAAREDMDAHYPNPGGWMVTCHPQHVHEFTYDEFDKVTVCEPCGQNPPDYEDH